MRYRRVKISNQGTIEAPAAKVWAALTSWGGSESASVTEPREFPPNPLGVIGVELASRHDAIPLTRILRFSSGLVIRETLLHQDDEALHIYYNIEGTGPHGIRNYLSTADIDDFADSLCQITINARFDMPYDEDIIKAKSFIDIAHNFLISGLQNLA